MNELPSATFRKTYAKLREPVVVTVNGHGIGMWTPLLSDREVLERVQRDVTGLDKSALAELLTRADAPAKQVVVTARPEGVFAQYRPVPKPGKR